MNLYSKLLVKDANNNPLRVAIIGAGKFASMYLAQVHKTPGIHVAAIADLNPANVFANLQRIGWAQARSEAASIDDAIRSEGTWVTDDWGKVISDPRIDIVIEATGNPPAAVEHILSALKHRKHVVNVTVEADALCGPYLAQCAQQNEVIYSLAYGDQPALICDLVDWARTSGFNVVAAGRGLSLIHI